MRKGASGDEEEKGWREIDMRYRSSSDCAYDLLNVHMDIWTDVWRVIGKRDRDTIAAWS